jgi:hypothetical protein
MAKAKKAKVNNATPLPSFPELSPETVAQIALEFLPNITIQRLTRDTDIKNKDKPQRPARDYWYKCTHTPTNISAGTQVLCRLRPEAELRESLARLKEYVSRFGYEVFDFELSLG